MALFSRQPENPKSGQAPKPTMPAASRAAAPAATGEARDYLDKGSKIMGKLFFEGPARIDGQVDGEISANDVLVIGESAVVTAKLNAVSVVIAGSTTVRRVEPKSQLVAQIGRYVEPTCSSR
jgi:cytoskeletal protein CcmA (bactofilin family)